MWDISAMDITEIAAIHVMINISKRIKNRLSVTPCPALAPWSLICNPELPISRYFVKKQLPQEPNRSLSSYGWSLQQLRNIWDACLKDTSFHFLLSKGPTIYASSTPTKSSVQRVEQMKRKWQAKALLNGWWWTINESISWISHGSFFRYLTALHRREMEPTTYSEYMVFNIPGIYAHEISQSNQQERNDLVLAVVSKTAPALFHDIVYSHKTHHQNYKNCILTNLPVPSTPIARCLPPFL